MLTKILESTTFREKTEVCKEVCMAIAYMSRQKENNLIFAELSCCELLIGLLRDKLPTAKASASRDIRTKNNKLFYRAIEAIFNMITNTDDINITDFDNVQYFKPSVTSLFEVLVGALSRQQDVLNTCEKICSIVVLMTNSDSRSKLGWCFFTC